jgi:hypothetical protein
LALVLLALTFYTASSKADIVSVPILNGQFTVSGSNIVLSNDIVLTVGDTLEIETNQFQLVQRSTTNTVIDEARFGQSVAICNNSCSVYTGAPLDSFATGVPQAGLLQRQVNQSRVYGITTSTVGNPVLTPGDTLRVNNIEVVVPDAPNNTVAGLVNAINNAGIPNVIATNSTNVNLIGDGSTKIFSIGSIYSSASSYTTVVYVDSVLQVSGVDYTYNNATQQLLFVSAPIFIAATSPRITALNQTLHECPKLTSPTMVAFSAT